MKRLLRLIALAGLVCGYAPAQVTVTPYTSPRWSFVDASGSPCGLCKLSTFVAGTTTAQPTYVDSTGISQNTNPITLDVSGSAQIWIGTATAYKFVLKDSIGTTIWTVDNVKGNGAGGIGTCTTNDAITYANTATNTLACDSLITINPSSHAINVGGPITGAFFSLTNLTTIPNSWTFDVTTPLTALLSLPKIPISDIATIPADSFLINATASTASPTAVSMPTGCTNGINYSTTTHTLTCSSISISLANLGAQAADTVVMNATGGSATPTAVPMPSGCSAGVNYSTSGHNWSCLAGGSPVCTGTTAPFTCYQNLQGGTILQWGQALGCGSGSPGCSTAITFPVAFTTTSYAFGGNCTTLPNCAVIIDSPSTTGFTLQYTAFVIVGGTGGNLGSQTGMWYAIGK